MFNKTNKNTIKRSIKKSLGGRGKDRKKDETKRVKPGKPVIPTKEK